MDEVLARKFEKLKDILRETGGCVIAWSGGVDSTLLAAAARDVLGDRCLTLTARSALYPRSEIERADSIARRRGIPHQTVSLDALAVPEVRHNPPDRCYHCKRAVFTQVIAYARSKGFKVVCDGTNADDAGDYRPGERAIEELGVRSPLKEAGLTKAEVRTLSREVYGLETADLPAMACLATRVPYGSEITPEKLRQVEAIEDFLRARGFGQYRARHHGDLVRLEVPAGDLPRLLADDLRAALIRLAKSLGFLYVTMDLEGYRTGSMNEGLDPTRRSGPPDVV